MFQCFPLFYLRLLLNVSNTQCPCKGTQTNTVKLQGVSGAELLSTHTHVVCSYVVIRAHRKLSYLEHYVSCHVCDYEIRQFYMYKYICDSYRINAAFFMKASYSFILYLMHLTEGWLIISLRSTAGISPVLKEMADFSKAVFTGRGGII